MSLGWPEQLQGVLFDELGLPKTRRTKTGYTTDGDALVGLLTKVDPDSRAASSSWHCRHRDVARLRQTIEGLLKTVADDGRIHTTFNQTDRGDRPAVLDRPTCRTSRSAPRRAAASARLRRRRGLDCLMTADYSQIEMRIMAHLSEDAALIEAFRSGRDFHSITASRVFGVAAATSPPGQRAKIKAMNYGLAYGLSAFGLGQQLRIDPVRHGPDGRVLRDASAASATTSPAWSTRPAAPATPRPSSAAAATCPT